MKFVLIIPLRRAICVVLILLLSFPAVTANSSNFSLIIDAVNAVCPWGFGDTGNPGVPGPIEIINANAIPIVLGDDDTSPSQAIVAAASQYGNGRVIGLGHDGFFINNALSLYDNKQFGINIINWLEGAQSKKKILVTTGHGEPWVASGDYKEFYSELQKRGYDVSTFPGTITPEVLSDVSVLLISCPGSKLTDLEINNIRSFVSNGGGLFLQGLGWAWVTYEKQSLDEYPLNKLAEPFGLKWVDGYISDITNNRNGCPVFHVFFQNIMEDTTEGSEEMTTHKESDFGSHSDSNLPPSIESLIPNPPSPQESGVSIDWIVSATDPDNDVIYYRFLLSGPRTGGKWTTVQDWSTSRFWRWNTDDTDIGSSSISVLIKDGKHPSSLGFDDFKNYSGFKITPVHLKDINVQVVNDLYIDDDKTVYYCQEGKYIYYLNRIYLAGPDLDKVKSVTYVLPQSFPNPEKVSDDPSNNFEIWILTWGRFNGVALITTKSGQVFEKQYYVSFKEKVEDAKRKGIPTKVYCGG